MSMSHCAFANISILLENNPAEEEEEAVHSMSIARTLQTFIFHKKTIICIFANHPEKAMVLVDNLENVLQRVELAELMGLPEVAAS